MCGVLQYLNGSATGRDKRLHGGGVISSRKLLLLSLPALHHGDRHQLLIHPCIQIQDLKHLEIRISVGFYNTAKTQWQ